jgi:hypothetical protein
VSAADIASAIGPETAATKQGGLEEGRLRKYKRAELSTPETSHRCHRRLMISYVLLQLQSEILTRWRRQLIQTQCFDLETHREPNP